MERFRRRRRGLQANAASGSQSSRDRSPIHEVFPAERHRCQYRALGPDSPLSVSVKPFSPAQPPEQLHQQISDNLGEGEVFARNIHRSHDSSRRYAIAHAFPAIRMHSDDAQPCRCLCWSKVFMQVEAIIAGESTSQRPPTSGKRRLLTPTRPISIKPIPPPRSLSSSSGREVKANCRDLHL